MIAAPFVQFACEGCGSGVYMFGRNDVPPGHYCLTCGFIEHGPTFGRGYKTNLIKQELHERMGTMRKLERTL
jgi:hypothetical protein